MEDHTGFISQPAPRLVVTPYCVQSSDCDYWSEAYCQLCSRCPEYGGSDFMYCDSGDSLADHKQAEQGERYAARQATLKVRRVSNPLDVCKSRSIVG